MKPDDTHRDIDTIGKNASSRSERRAVWQDAVGNVWAARDVAKVQRFEIPGKDYFLAMWEYPKGLRKSRP